MRRCGLLLVIVAALVVPQTASAADTLELIPRRDADLGRAVPTPAASASTASCACWGDDSSGQTDAPGGEILAVSAGGAHSCAIRADGTLACWGSNADGQLTGVPTGQFVAVAAGGAHSCAIRADGTLACWGSNAERATDRGSRPGSSSPSPRAAPTPARSAPTAPSPAGAATPTGQLTGVPDRASSSPSPRAAPTAARSAPTAPSPAGAATPSGQLTGVPTGQFRSVAAGDTHTCAIARRRHPRLLGQQRGRTAHRRSGEHDPLRSQPAARTPARSTPTAPPTCWGERPPGRSNRQPRRRLRSATSR